MFSKAKDMVDHLELGICRNINGRKCVFENPVLVNSVQTKLLLNTVGGGAYHVVTYLLKIKSRQNEKNKVSECKLSNSLRNTVLPFHIKTA